MSTTVLLPEMVYWKSLDSMVSYHAQLFKDVFGAEVYSLGQKHVANELLKSEFIVLPYLTPYVSTFLKSIRLVDPDIRFIIYVHGHGTRFFWDYHHWDILENFTNQDIFLCANEGDQLLIAEAVEGATTYILPYFNQTPSKTNEFSFDRFFYIGRVDPFKNAHSTLRLLQLLADSSNQVAIYGALDFDKTNPFALEQKVDYASFLQSHFNDFSEIFKGHWELKRLQSIQGTGTLVSLSLNPHENFGLAAYENLVNGGKAILSDWGGHRILKQLFGDNVLLVPVTISGGFPYISEQELTAVASSDFIHKVPVQNPIDPHGALERLKHMLKVKVHPRKQLKMKGPLLSILEKRKEKGLELKWDLKAKKKRPDGDFYIFDSFQDKEFQLLVNLYAGKKMSSVHEEGDFYFNYHFQKSP